jgi:hypothetical protein
MPAKFSDYSAMRLTFEVHKLFHGKASPHNSTIRWLVLVEQEVLLVSARGALKAHFQCTMIGAMRFSQDLSPSSERVFKRRYTLIGPLSTWVAQPFANLKSISLN